VRFDAEQLVRNIVWLASYPRSGNTWFRIVLELLASERQEGVDLDRLGIPNAASRALLEHYLGVETSDLTAEEIDALRPLVYERIARESTRVPTILKVHDAFRRLPDGRSLFEEAVTRAVIYLVRNPLDVVLSLHHFSRLGSVDESIDRLGDAGHTLCSGAGTAGGQVRQVLQSWSRHVRSWVDESALPVHVVRYEDLSRDPRAAIERALNFAAMPFDPSRLAAAVDATRFDRLRDLEQADGFRERPRGVDSFFREGRVGAWRENLSPRLVERIIADHAVEMRRQGYLDLLDRPAPAIGGDPAASPGIGEARESRTASTVFRPERIDRAEDRRDSPSSTDGEPRPS
jgi:hypothetical protein